MPDEENKQNQIEKLRQQAKLAREKKLREQERLRGGNISNTTSQQSANPQQKMRIGDRLIQAGLITQEHLIDALKDQKKHKIRKKLVKTLVDLGHLQTDKLLHFFVDECKLGHLDLRSILFDFPASETEILQKLADILGYSYVDLEKEHIDYKITSKVPLNQLRKMVAIPIRETELNTIVAFRDPFDLGAQSLLQRFFRTKPVKIVISEQTSIMKYLVKADLHENTKGLIENIKREVTLTGDRNGESSSILQLIEVIFKNSILQKSSDIHIESVKNGCIVRSRIDGILTESFVFDEIIEPPLISRIKLLANMDIAEKRKPQDGRFSMVIVGKDFDFRVSTLPILTGESLVIRILDKSKIMIDINNLGISKFQYNSFKEVIRRPYGMIFVTGPTGSGKTTTLYATLNRIKNVTKKIITVEDPIEYQLNQVQQVQVNEKVGITFATSLKTILRQDPDVIMVGEVRDSETLEIAIQAALTGHLVFSTLHTNSATGAVTRLLDMGIEPFFISSALGGVLAQRLIRKLCPHCKEKTDIPDRFVSTISDFLPDNYQFYKRQGCPQCSMTGYNDRDMITEFLEITGDIASLIASGGSESDILEMARKNNFITMFEDGINKASQGLTTIEEVFRVSRLT